MSKLICKIADHFMTVVFRILTICLLLVYFVSAEDVTALIYDCGLFHHSVRIWVVCFCMVVNVLSFSNCVSVSVNLLSGH